MEIKDRERKWAEKPRRLLHSDGFSISHGEKKDRKINGFGHRLKVKVLGNKVPLDLDSLSVPYFLTFEI